MMANIQIFRISITLIVLIFLSLLCLASTAQAQMVNPFAREPAQPPVVDEPEPIDNSPNVPGLNPLGPGAVPQPQQPVISPQRTVQDFQTEFDGLEVVAIRNGIAAARVADRLYFIKDKESFQYNGVDYLASVANKRLELFVEREEQENLSVFSYRVGDIITLSSLSELSTQASTSDAEFVEIPQ